MESKTGRAGLLTPLKHEEFVKLPKEQTMTTRPFIVSPQDYPRALSVLGVQITVLAPNTATQSYEITLQEGAQGMGPPPHKHDWDESFFVLTGTIELSCAGKTQYVQAGTLVHVPAGTVHAFRFGDSGGSMLELSGAGGSATKVFTHLDREVPVGSPDIPKVIDILQRYGVAVDAGPAPAVAGDETMAK
jgi:quercetin dioxygenase-like cupin family protein